MSVPRIRTDAELDARVKLLKVDPERFYRENPRVRFSDQDKDSETPDNERCQF